MPTHVAVIMDGNGRWAEQRGKPRSAGHRAGVKAVKATVEHAARCGIRHLTLFAFSSENWQRPAAEINSLMSLFVEALQREVPELHRNNVRLEFVGDRERLDGKLLKKISSAEARTAGNDGLHLVVAVAYGGRWDIAQAAGRVARKVAEGTLAVGDVDEDALASELQFSDLPDVDLLIRTGGEQRISNFLLWNLAYSELWFCDTLWPEFDEQQFDAALDYFSRRQRRYGRTRSQLEVAEC